MSSIQHDKEMKKLKAICLSKVGYTSLLAANYALEQMVRLPNSIRLNIYPCPECGIFHIGKLSEYWLNKHKDEKISNSNTRNSNSSNSYISITSTKTTNS